MILGAGASMPLGFPGTNCVTTSCRENQAHLQLPDLSASMLRDTIDALDRLYGAPDDGAHCWNFEQLVHALETLSTLQRSSNRQTGSTMRVVETAFSQLCCPFSHYAENWGQSVQNARLAVMKHIASLFQGISLDAQTQAQAFYQSLDNRFALRIATLNYDDAIEQLLGWGPNEQGFVPPDRRGAHHFCVHSEPRLLHLHGSCHFGYPARLTDEMPRQDIYDLAYFEAPSDAMDSWLVGDGGQSQDRRDIGMNAIVSGHNKTAKLLPEPYLSYWWHLQAMLRKCPRIVVVGYGFGDLHLNTLLDNLRLLHGDDLRIALIDYYNSDDYANDRFAVFQRLQRWSNMREPLEQMAKHDETEWFLANQKLLLTFAGFEPLWQTERTTQLVDFLSS